MDATYRIPLVRMNKRQKLIANILAMKDGSVSNVCCQKLLFYFSQLEIKEGKKPTFEFIPWARGGYSFTLHLEKDNLQEAGIIENNEDSERNKIWTLSESAEIPVPDKQDLNRLKEVVSELGYMTDAQLVQRLYIEYPQYAFRSRVFREVLSDFPDIIKEIEQIKQEVESQFNSDVALYTIGYEGLSIEEFFERLYRNKIDFLIDVRKVPFSHKLGFSKSKLEQMCDGKKIRYKHFPELGIPSHMRTDLVTQEDYDKLFEEYKESILPQNGALLHKLASLVKQGQRIALVCFEANPMQCHRRIVADKLSEISGEPYTNLTRQVLPTCPIQAALEF